MNIIDTYTAFPGDPVPNGLVAHWLFDNSPNDETSNGYDLALNGDATYGTDQNGVSNSALSLDGDGDEATAGDVLGFEYNEPFSISAWVYITDFTNLQAVVSKALTSAGDLRGYRVSVHNSSNKVQFLLRNASDNAFVLNSLNVVSLNTWTHIAATWNGSSGLVYINGIDDSDVPAVDNLSQTMLNNSEFKIGGWYLSSHYVDGLINDVRIYDRDLSAQEVLDIYNYEKP